MQTPVGTSCPRQRRSLSQPAKGAGDCMETLWDTRGEPYGSLRLLQSSSRFSARQHNVVRSSSQSLQKTCTLENKTSGLISNKVKSQDLPGGRVFNAFQNQRTSLVVSTPCLSPFVRFPSLYISSSILLVTDLSESTRSPRRAWLFSLQS